MAWPLRWPSTIWVTPYSMATAPALGASKRPFQSLAELPVVYSGHMALRNSSPPPVSSSAGTVTVSYMVRVTVRVMSFSRLPQVRCSVWSPPSAL